MDLIIPERYRQAHWHALNKALGSGHTKYNHSLITRSLHINRNPFYVDMSFSVLKNLSGEVIGAMACARDITERFLKEKRLEMKIK